MQPSVGVRGGGIDAALGSVAQVGGVLPEGFAVPPLVYTAFLAIGVLTVGALLWVLSPPVTHQTVLALATWMMVGGTLHAIYQLEVLPEEIEPLLATPAVYATVAIVAGSLWVVTTLYSAMSGNSADKLLGIVGGGVFVALFTTGIVDAVTTRALEPIPAVIALVATAVVAALVWLVLGLFFTDAAAITSWSGAVVVFSHALDGVTTAVGHDMLGAAERTPLSEAVLSAGEMLPTAQYVGAGWLFVFVKVLLAATIVVLFRDWVRDEQRTALLVLAAIAAVGLGPGTHNLVLFALGGA